MSELVDTVMGAAVDGSAGSLRTDLSPTLTLEEIHKVDLTKLSRELSDTQQSLVLNSFVKASTSKILLGTVSAAPVGGTRHATRRALRVKGLSVAPAAEDRARAGEPPLGPKPYLTGAGVRAGAALYWQTLKKIQPQTAEEGICALIKQWNERPEKIQRIQSERRDHVQRARDSIDKLLPRIETVDEKLAQKHRETWEREIAREERRAHGEPRDISLELTVSVEIALALWVGNKE